MYADYCRYSTTAWGVFRTATAEGHDLNPYWPRFALQRNQREGARSETYLVVFDADGKLYRYHVRDATELARFGKGSHWTLTIGGLGGVASVKPAQ